MEMEKTLERVERWFVVALTVWGACAFVAAASGAISKVPRLLLGPLLLTETVVPILVYYLSKSFRSYISSIDLKHLSYPVILIPLIGVPVSGALHVMAIDIAVRKLKEGTGLKQIRP